MIIKEIQKAAVYQAAFHMDNRNLVAGLLRLQRCLAVVDYHFIIGCCVFLSDPEGRVRKR